jgi:capsular polysaccharide export protein
MPLLRIPPFPGSKPFPLGVASESAATPGDEALELAVQLIRDAKVAGSYWGSQPDLPEGPYVLARIRNDTIEAHSTTLPVVLWTSSEKGRPIEGRMLHRVSGDCDPWHLLSGASEVVVDADDELALIAAIAGVPVRCLGSGPYQAVAGGHAGLLQVLRGPSLGACEFVSPFDGEPITLSEAIDLCAFWRRLIDSNRPIRAAIGFASWKRTTVAPLLWQGSHDVRFATDGGQVEEGDEVAVWRSRVAAEQLANLAQRGARLVEVEDGFIRSVGLGADCIPPLSIIVDRLGIYFDPNQPSDLELLLEEGGFPDELVARAGRLRRLIVESGISKYDVGGPSAVRRSNEKRNLLVIGQVEDDRSVRCGGGSVQSNVELLRRVRQGAPDAFISYRPHPDVQAGHRIGHIADDQLAGLADEVVQSGSISQSIEMADEVHVITSLAGFEALLRGKVVTTYGVPFYAGWGLTRDLGDIPSRRMARRTLDELVAAVLLLYPRYLDPLTGLPCPAEILALRLAEGSGFPPKGLLVRLRQMQGRWRRRISALRSRVSK